MKDLKLTEKERELFGDNEVEIRQNLISKVLLNLSEKADFSEEDNKQIEMLYNGEVTKYFLAKKMEGKVKVSEADVTKVYTENKANFDVQRLSFTQAKEIIQRDLLNQQIIGYENEELTKIVSEMKKNVEISREDMLASQGNAEIMKSLLVNKIVGERIKEEGFDKEAAEQLAIIKDNVTINYYLDFEVRKNVSVTQEEVTEIYEREKAKLGNITPNSAYNQIANGLLNNRVVEERDKFINKLVEEYKIEELVKENLVVENDKDKKENKKDKKDKKEEKPTVVKKTESKKK